MINLVFIFGSFKNGRFYMKRFGGYDTSFVQPDKNAKVDLSRF
jgi:hypothetical protein